MHDALCETKQQFDALNVPDLDIAGYILDRQSVQQRDDAIRAADEAMSTQAQGVREREDFITERKERERLGKEEHDKKYQEYLEDLDAPTQADRDTVRALAGIALAIEKNQAAQYAYLDRIDPASIQNKKILSDEVARLSTEFRQLQKMLGIDMPTRIKAEQQATGIDVVRDIVIQSAEFISKEMVEVEHCGILISWVAPFFSEMGYDYTTICPRCNEPIHIHKEAEEKDVSKMWEQAEEGRDRGSLLPEVRLEDDSA